MLTGAGLKAVAEVIAEGKVRTYDMGGADSTLDMAKAIAEKCAIAGPARK